MIRTVNEPSPAICHRPNLLASARVGPKFCSRPFPSFRWVKNQDHWPREKLPGDNKGPINPRCGDVLAVSRGHSGEEARWPDESDSREISVNFFPSLLFTAGSLPVRSSGPNFSRTAFSVGEGLGETTKNRQTKKVTRASNTLAREELSGRNFTFTPNSVRSGEDSPLGSTRGRETQRKSSSAIGEASPRPDPRTRARARREARARRSQRRDSRRDPLHREKTTLSALRSSEETRRGDPAP